MFKAQQLTYAVTSVRYEDWFHSRPGGIVEGSYTACTGPRVRDCLLRRNSSPVSAVLDNPTSEHAYCLAPIAPCPPPSHIAILSPPRFQGLFHG